MRHLGLSDIKHAALSLRGERLTTITKGKGFSVEIEADGLYYPLESTGKRRRQTWKDVEGVLGLFNENASFRPKDYKKISGCASYLLPIIRKALS